MMEFGVVIHGGAWKIPDEACEAHRQGVKAACQAAFEILARGGSALDAAEAAVVILEDDPTFDAGVGSFVTQAGEVELDAIFGADDLRVGSVCAVQHVRNPIKVARLVMEQSPHTLLAGTGATEFAKEHAIELVETESLLVGRELERFHAIRAQRELFVAKDAFRHVPADSTTATATDTTTTSTIDTQPSKGQGLGTVGCVCIDQQGHAAVAVSTGGTPFKRRGRVGDSPIWGAGAYLDGHVAVAATGYGEDLYRVLACRTAVDYATSHRALPSELPSIATDESSSFAELATAAAPFAPRVQASVHAAIADLTRRANGLGGLIAIGPDGIGLAWNTPRMAYAYRTSSMDTTVVGV